MKKNKNNNDLYSVYYYKFNNKKNQKVKFLTVLFCLVIISTLIFFSISFSNVLTISKIVNVNSNYIFEGKTLYAISLDNDKNLSTAKTKALSYKNQGAGGYVYFYNQTYHILSSIYKSLNEANSVKDNLKQNNVNAQILNIVMPALNLKVNLTTKSRQILNKGINLFYNNYSKIYDYSISFDKQDIEFLQLKSLMQAQNKDNLKIISDFNKYFASSSNVYILYVKVYLNKLTNKINEFLSLDESKNLSSEIKSLYINIVFDFLDLSEEVL